MKMRKAVIALFATLLLSDVCSAQVYKQSRYYNKQTDRLDYGYKTFPRQYYGFRLGLDFSHISSDDKAHGDDSKTGLNIGFVYGYGLTDQAPLYLETGFSYVEKGGKSTESGVKYDYNLNYIEVPIVVKYIYSTGSGVSVQPLVGGYLALGVGGKVKNYSEKEKYDSFGSDEPAYRRFDAGLKFGCGVGYEIAYAELVYNLGLANISHDSFDSAHNRGLLINIGVNF